MKKILYAVILLSFALFISCQKDKTVNTELNQSQSHVIGKECSNYPANLANICLAYFERWFYNPTTKKCELLGYSGCAPLYGVETLNECNECAGIKNTGKCHDVIDTNRITCQAYWEGWFYNSTLNKCEKIGYSGCGPDFGCRTEQECKSCAGI